MRTALALLSVLFLATGCPPADEGGDGGGGTDAGATEDTGGGGGEDAGGGGEDTGGGGEEDAGEEPTCNVAETGSGLGPVASCDAEGLNSCFANSDCAADERCEGITDNTSDDVACCVPGLRGCKGVGELCDSEFQCEEGVCIGRNDDPNRCSQRCDSNDDCPSEVPECNAFLGFCVTAGE